MTSAPPRLPYHYAQKFKVLMVDEGEPAEAVVYCIETPPLAVLVELQRLSPVFKIERLNKDAFAEKLTQSYEAQSSIAQAAIGMEEDIDLGTLAYQMQNQADLLDNQDDAPIIKLINAIFTQAIKQKASDIHIETYENRVLVRYRIDGVLQEILDIQRAIAPLVISRVKVMAKLDIAEKRIPQDGRIAIRIGGRSIDVRVSTLPSNHGERIVLRILDKQAANLNLQSLGLKDPHLNQLRSLIHEPNGIILVTGPTGSGKTTTLYAMLTELNEVSRNILTIEDPIEYDLPGVGQTQVNTKVQMTFAKGLRAILRQDPDVVMIGEIRDLETAEIAVQASLTGHLVLSTLHTNSALGAISRLIDMGVESFLLSSSLQGLIAQRLVRKLCMHCKEARPIRADEWRLFNLNGQENTDIYDPKGCEQCSYTGYQGRTAIYEIIPMDDTLRGMIHRQDSLQDIEAYLRPFTKSIRQDGLDRILDGTTSIAEVIRVTSQNQI